MSALNPTRRDPAPSRLRYRLQRLWLTPTFRFYLRYGLPFLALSTAAIMIWSTETYRFPMQAKYAELRRFVEERPEFMVHVMAIDGASASIAEDIREIVPVDLPLTSFDLDLPGMQARIAELDAVARVDVRIRSGGVLQVDIVERQPAAVWRAEGGLELLDGEGHRVAVIASRLDRPELPLLAGLGAEQAVPEALALLAAAAPVAERIRGLLRVGERRWDLVLDRDQRIMLPETQPLEALEQIMALHQARDLLDRDLILVDFRNPARPILRLGQTAVEHMKATENGQTGSNQ